MDTVIAASVAICFHFTNEHMETVQQKEVRNRFIYVDLIIHCSRSAVFSHSLRQLVFPWKITTESSFFIMNFGEGIAV